MADQTGKTTRQSALRHWGKRLFRVVCFGMIVSSVTFCTTELCRVSPLYFITTLFSDISDEASLLKPFAANISSWFDLTAFLFSFFVFICCFVKRRFFCVYICPLGLILDIGVLIRRKLFKKKILKNGVPLASKKFQIFFSTFWGLSFLPLLFPSKYFEVFDAVTPLFLDPLSILSRTLHCDFKFYGAAIAFTVCFLVSPYFWRYRICPCGLLQDLLYWPSRIVKKIRFQKDTKITTIKVRTQRATRRQFFITAGIIIVASTCVSTLKKFSINIKGKFFRPPGVDNEAQFLSRCARCGRCSKVCPAKIIQPIEYDDALAKGLPEVQARLISGTPKIEFTSYCAENCVACSNICPTRAIKSFSKEEKKKTHIGVATFELEKCMLYYNRECSICKRQCPYEAIAFEWSDDVYANIPIIDADKCVGCGQCVAYCPGEPIVNIFGEVVEEEKEEPREKALKIIMR